MTKIQLQVALIAALNRHLESMPPVLNAAQTAIERALKAELRQLNLDVIANIRAEVALLP